MPNVFITPDALLGYVYLRALGIEPPPSSSGIDLFS